MARQKQPQKPRSGRKTRSSPPARTSDRESGQPRLSFRQQQALSLQQQVGNQGTQLFLQAAAGGGFLQRTQVNLPAGSETLHNTRAGGQFSSNTYRVGTRGVNYEGKGIRYQMTRGANRVNVNVRIKFVQQFGSSTGAASPVPAGQPRQVARSMCTQLLAFWNTSNRFELLGMRQPSFWERMGIGSGPRHATRVRLPVRFHITPVFDLGAAAHATVQLDTTHAGGSAAGRVVNASHWYSTLDPSAYVGGIGDTYAHEFGHLLGIPDEYSLGNPAAHDLMHRISPNAATRANLDRTIDNAGVREMILAAIRPQIQSQLRSQAANLSNVLMGQKDQLTQLVSDKLRDSWRDAGTLSGVGDQVRAQLQAAGQNRALSMLNQALRFEATENLSNLTIARRTVPAELDPRQLGLLLSRATAAAAQNAEQGDITLPYQNARGAAASIDMTVEVASGVSSATSPLAASAQATAEAAVGAPAAGPVANAHLYPSNTLMSQLMAMPGRWADLGAEMSTQLNEMPDLIYEAVFNHLSGTNISDTVRNSVPNLYRALLNLVTMASNVAVTNTVRNFLYDKIYPLVDSQVTDVMSLVDAEIARHHTASGTGTTASPSATPIAGLMAAVQQMQQKARTMVNPAAPAAGGTANQNVRYTTNSLMGRNSRGTSLRAEQLRSLVEQFNAHRPDLRHNNEDPFTIRMAG